jgi:hypothetical protein
MRILGIDLRGNDFVYVAATCEGAFVAFDSSDKITLTDTRTPDALQAFQRTLQTVLRETRPERIGVKWKREEGMRSAGPAAIKMEALLLVNSPCPVEFVKPKALETTEMIENQMPKYMQDAVRAALAVR